MDVGFGYGTAGVAALALGSGGSFVLKRPFVREEGPGRWLPPWGEELCPCAFVTGTGPEEPLLVRAPFNRRG